MRAITEAQRIAERVRDHLWAGDRASQGLGMQVNAIGIMNFHANAMT